MIAALISHATMNLLKNSLAVKKSCGPVQNGQCEKGCEI